MYVCLYTLLLICSISCHNLYLNLYDLDRLCFSSENLSLNTLALVCLVYPIYSFFSNIAIHLDWGNPSANTQKPLHTIKWKTINYNITVHMFYIHLYLNDMINWSNNTRTHTQMRKTFAWGDHGSCRLSTIMHKGLAIRELNYNFYNLHLKSSTRTKLN